VQQFHRTDIEAGAAKYIGLERDVVDVVILQPTAALDLAQSPGSEG